ncbi:MAG: hypothetical protein AAGM22_25375 [Acidobacteriota bacterium]
MTEVHVTAPLWVNIVSGAFLLWNLFGLAVFVLAMTKFRKKEALENAGLNEKQIELTLSTPTWVNIAFGIAVIFGVLGCLALVLKMKVAIPLLVLSLLGVIAQNLYTYVLSDTVKHMGVGASPAVIAGAVALVPFALFCASKGWLQ